MPEQYMSIDEFAEDFEGNWLKFSDFAWHDQPDDAEHWGHYTVEVRGSGLVDISNRAVIEKIMQPYLGRDAEIESHSHFAHGWVEVLTVRVRNKRGNYTKAFKALWGIILKLQQYQILDDEDHSQREYDATLVMIEENIGETRDKLPKDWKEQMFSALWDVDLLESTDQGFWTDQKNLIDAAFGLGFLSFDAAVEAGKIDDRLFEAVVEAAEGQITEIAMGVREWPEIVVQRMYEMGLDLTVDEHGEVKRSEVAKALANLHKHESDPWLVKEAVGQVRLFNPRGQGQSTVKHLSETGARAGAILCGRPRGAGGAVHAIYSDRVRRELLCPHCLAIWEASDVSDAAFERALREHRV